MDPPDGNVGMSTCVVVSNLYREKGIKCCVNYDFSGVWAQDDTNNTEIFMTNMGYLIFYVGCALFWCRKLQTNISLITKKMIIQPLVGTLVTCYP